MSFKTTAQFLILLIIAFIIGSVYYNYFSIRNNVEQNINENEEKIVDEQNLNSKKNEAENINKIENENANNNISNINKKPNLEKKDLKNDSSENDSSENDSSENDSSENNSSENNSSENDSSENDSSENNSSENDSKNNKETVEEVSNILKEVEYLTIDNKGNKYRIFANSGSTSKENKDILELDKVRGIITSEKRSTLYIVSDFAKYNSSNQNSHFYQNVVINFEDKKIECNYFDINMQTSLAIAYGNVIVTDPKSIMKAGKITLDMETKDINIESGAKKKVKIETD